MEDDSKDSSDKEKETGGGGGKTVDSTKSAEEKAKQTFIENLAAKNSFIAETVLDLEACADVFKRVVKKKAAEEVPKSEAVYIPPIEADGRASTCPSKWDDMSGADRFRLCSQCKLYMYDFTGMTRKEAEAQVFKRENREDNIKFYKRVDKRFLTKDCPVGAKRLRNEKLRFLGLVLFVGCTMVGLCWHHKSAEMPAMTESVSLATEPTQTPVVVAEQPKETETSTSAQPGAAQNDSSAIAASVPQIDGHPVASDGQIIPEGTTYVTKYRRLEFFEGEAKGAENVSLTDDRVYNPGY